ncbi:hypothetical protein D3C86_2047930 [compost metagenome]
MSIGPKDELRKKDYSNRKERELNEGRGVDTNLRENFHFIEIPTEFLNLGINIEASNRSRRN